MTETEKQTIDFWNSEESLKRYTDIKYYLWDSEVMMFFKAVQELGKKPQEISVLDLGCGGGRTTIPLHNMGFKVKAVDIAEKLVQNLKQKFPDVDAEVGDAMDLKMADGTFDIVIFSHNSLDCLYPESARFKALSEISRVLKPGGYFVFSSHVFNVLPFNLEVLQNILRNLVNFIKSPTRGYYDEKMKSGDVVKLYYSTFNVLKEQLLSKKLSVVYQTRIIELDKNLGMTFLRSMLNWERYYLAKKQ